MAKDNVRHNRPVSDSLHPLVNAAIVGLVLVFVLGVWMFFDADTYDAWLDVVVTGLFVMAIGIPFALWLTWRRHADGAKEASAHFRDWIAGEFDTWTGRVTATSAATSAAAQVLLPIAAVAVGMTVLGLVFHIIASGAT